MKRGVSCSELDPALMEVRDHEGAEYPGQYWINGAKIKVRSSKCQLLFCRKNMLGACTSHILFPPDRIDVSRTIEGIEIFTLDNNNVSQFPRVLNDLEIFPE